MLGLIGKQRQLAGVKGTVKDGKNVYAVSLNPWDIIEDVPVSAKHPTGKKITPAASQEDFKRLLAVPGVNYIGELTSQQETEAIASLEKYCAWYQKQMPKNTPAPIKAETISIANNKS